MTNTNKDERMHDTQQKLLLAIAFRARAGYAPSIRDLMADCNISSPSVVRYHLETLRERGMVDWIDGAARTIHLVKKAS